MMGRLLRGLDAKVDAAVAAQVDAALDPGNRCSCAECVDIDAMTVALLTRPAS